MLRSMLQARRDSGRAHAFSLVEILIVILIIAVLLAVALPQLLGSRDSGLDAAAKQQLSNALTEISAYTLRTEVTPTDAADIKTKGIAANINIVAGDLVAGTGVTNGIVTGTNARAVSYVKTADGFTIAAYGANNCWAIAVQRVRTLYYGKKNSTDCNASNVAAPTGANAVAKPWFEFGFPSEAQ